MKLTINPIKLVFTILGAISAYHFGDYWGVALYLGVVA
jgi:hypothetical protein